MRDLARKIAHCRRTGRDVRCDILRLFEQKKFFDSSAKISNILKPLTAQSQKHSRSSLCVVSIGSLASRLSVSRFSPSYPAPHFSSFVFIFFNRYPFSVSRLPSPVLYLRTGTGACPYDCDCFSRLSPLASRLSPLPSPVSRLPSPLSRLPAFASRLSPFASSLSRLPSSRF